MAKRTKHYAHGFASAFDDLPDGAFFAALDEFGIDPEALIDEPPAKTQECPECGRRFATKRSRADHRRDKHGYVKPQDAHPGAPDE